MWTDQKHNLFLQHLELSFVKQLHQSISLLDQDGEEKSTTLIDQINVHNITSKHTFNDTGAFHFVTMIAYAILLMIFMCSSWLVGCMDVGRLSAIGVILFPMFQLIPLAIINVLLYQLMHQNLGRFVKQRMLGKLLSLTVICMTPIEVI